MLNQRANFQKNAEQSGRNDDVENDKRLVPLAGALTLAGGVLVGGSAANAESSDPIKMTLHDWTGQLITTKIMGEVLKKSGYYVDYVQADYIAQFAGLKTGDLDVAMEIWETTGREAMDEATGTGKVENMGRLACRPSRNGGSRNI